MGNELILIEDVELVGKVKLSNISAAAGDVLWVETMSSLYSDLAISFLLGLLSPKKGKYRLAGSKISNSKQKRMISFFDASWNPGVKNAETFVKMVALNYKVQISQASSEFKRIIKGLGAEYALQSTFSELKPATKSIVSTAATLSFPFLVVLLKEPYYGLEKHASEFLTTEISRISKDGSLVIIFSESTPMIFTKQVQIVEEF